MFKNLSAGLPFASAGLQIGGGIADALERKREAGVVDIQKKLALRSSKKQQAQTMGRQIAATGGAGVELSGTTLDKINQTHMEFELDQAIIRESARLEKQALGREGMQDFMSGLTGAAETLIPSDAKPMFGRRTQRSLEAMLKKSKV